uniref:Integral membrane protein n=1 Tax=Kitasatospora sp. CMC57 TaxID=3231513 RepID=A0AB33K602_9ACTN
MTRAVRAAVFAALVVLFAALGQVVLTGRPLPVSVVGLAGLAAFLVGFAFVGSGWGFGRIIAVLLPTQLAVGVLFDLGQLTCTVPGGTRPLAGFEPLVCSGGSIGEYLLSPGSTPAPLAGLPVLVGHLLVALLASWALCRSEAALTRQATTSRLLGELLAGVWRVLRLPVPRPARPVLRQPIPESSRARIPADDILLRPALRRGPPVFAPAC